MAESEIPRRVKMSNSNGIDRISGLPDPLISHILSLLPTKEAVATSVLSTRWKVLWTSITNLDFDFTNCERYSSSLGAPELKKKLKMKRRKCTRIVKRVLFLLTSPSIHKFDLSLCCGDCFNLDNLNSWISVGFGRTVEEITFNLDQQYLNLRVSQICCDVAVLKLNGNICLDIPATASLCCPSLKVLDLQGVTCEIASNASVSFPNLKIMRLDLVKFDNTGSVNKLLSSSPQLDDLYIEDATYNDMEELIIHLPSLTRLSLLMCTLEYEDMRKLKINAPALQYLYLNGSLTYQCLIVENLSSLHLVNLINLFYVEDDVNTGTSIIKFVGGLSKVKFLYVPSDLLKAFWILSTNVTLRFHNLTLLEIRLYKCLDLSMLFNGFLESMHNLEHLVMKTFTCGGIRCPKQSWWIEPPNVPKCLIRRLTTVSFRGITGCSDQLELLRYFLKNAKVLQMLTLGANRIFEKQRTVLLQKILLMRRASHTCQVSFI